MNGLCDPSSLQQKQQKPWRGSPRTGTVAETLQGSRRPTENVSTLWETPHNVLAWVATVEHKKLGIRYINTSFVFFILGGLEAAVMRVQLARPESHLLTPEAYNQLFTMHGTTMMFLFIQPVLSGFSFYLIPLMTGARELASRG